MNYEEMWNELKAKLEEDVKYHRSGIMQSIGESLHGEIKCLEILEYIREIEERHI